MTAQDTQEPLLVVEDVEVRYGAFIAVERVSMSVDRGEILGVAGPNGAGKSTLLKAISGILRPSSGAVYYRGKPTGVPDRRQSQPTRWMVRNGMTLVPEGRHLFGELTVEENLLFGAAVGNQPSGSGGLRQVFDLFPQLEERSRQKASTLSGGEQQMVAIGRGLMSNPTVLLIDEMSLGLAPSVTAQVTEALRQLREETQLSLILVEENLGVLSKLADRVVFMKAGRSVATRAMDEVDIEEASDIYLA